MDPSDYDDDDFDIHESLPKDGMDDLFNQNKNFSVRCLKRIAMISSEIVTADEQDAGEAGEAGDGATE